MYRQIGEFFIFIGLILLVIFFASDQNQERAWGYFIVGLALVALGAIMMFRRRGPEIESSRFRTYRKLRDKPKKVKKKIEE
jgi:Na+/melibiose symporter-like transporter